EAEVRIELPAGSYMPEFWVPPTSAATALKPAALPFPVTPLPVLPVWRSRLGKPTARIWAAGVVLSGITIAAVTLYKPVDALNQFWGPVWNSTDSIVLGVGRLGAPTPPSPANALPSAS